MASKYKNRRSRLYVETIPLEDLSCTGENSSLTPGQDDVMHETHLNLDLDLFKNNTELKTDRNGFENANCMTPSSIKIQDQRFVENPQKIQKYAPCQQNLLRFEPEIATESQKVQSPEEVLTSGPCELHGPEPEIGSELRTVHRTELGTIPNPQKVHGTELGTIPNPQKVHRPEPEGATDSASEDLSRPGRFTSSGQMFHRPDVRLDLSMLGQRQEPPGCRTGTTSPKRRNFSDSYLDIYETDLVKAPEHQIVHPTHSLPDSGIPRGRKVRRRPFWRRKKKKSRSQVNPSPDSIEQQDVVSVVARQQTNADGLDAGIANCSLDSEGARTNRNNLSSDEENNISGTSVHSKAQVHVSAQDTCSDDSLSPLPSPSKFPQKPAKSPQRNRRHVRMRKAGSRTAVSLPPIDTITPLNQSKYSPRTPQRTKHPPKPPKKKSHDFTNAKLHDLLSQVNFTEEQLEEFKVAFRLFDKDQDGFISSREVRTLLVSVGQDPSSDQVAVLMEHLDVDGSGSIEFQEFLLLMHRLIGDLDTEDDMVEVFRVLDQDGDGYISKADLRDVAARLESGLTHHDLDEMFAEADKDGDGQINFEEFIKIIMCRF